MTGVARGAGGDKMSARFCFDIGDDPMATRAVAGGRLDIGVIFSIQKSAGYPVTEVARCRRRNVRARFALGADAVTAGTGAGLDVGVIEGGEGPGKVGRVAGVAHGVGRVATRFGRGMLRITAAMADVAGTRCGLDVAVIVAIQESTGNRMAGIARGCGRNVVVRLALGSGAVAAAAGAGLDIGMVEAASHYPGGEGRVAGVTRSAGDRVGARLDRRVFRVTAPVAGAAGARRSLNVAMIMAIEKTAGNRMAGIARGRGRNVIGRLALGGDTVTA